MTKVIVSLHVDEDALKDNLVENKCEDIENYDIRSEVSSELGWVEQSGISVGEILSVEQEEETKYFFRQFKIRDGEREYYSATTFSCDSKEQAEAITQETLLNFYGTEEEEEDGGAYHCGGEVHVSLYSLREVSKLEYDILSKHV
jgi:hypothetical protein